MLDGDATTVNRSGPTDPAGSGAWSTTGIEMLFPPEHSPTEPPDPTIVVACGPLFVVASAKPSPPLSQTWIGRIPTSATDALAWTRSPESELPGEVRAVACTR